jgi:zinc/manganese transport system permease protein
MLAHEFMRNAALAGTFVALACGALGWFVVLRGQLFAGDALGHVAFPGALAAAAAGVDQRLGLFAATVLAAAGMGLLARGALARRGAVAYASPPADDTAIGVAFMLLLALGVLFLSLFSSSSGVGAGAQAARTLFGSIFGLGAGEARLAAAIALAALAALAARARPRQFASIAPDVAAARAVPVRALGVAFLALLGVVVAEAAQAVGALLALGLLALPAAAAHRLARGPAAGIALAAAIALAATWGGLALAYAVPWLPPSTAIVGLSAIALAASELLA